MFFNQPVTVIRSRPGSYGPDGIWREPARIWDTVQTSLQPVGPEDMALLPEGRREQGAYALYTREPINTAREGINADRVLIHGRTYECLLSENWQNGLIPHFRAIVVLEGEQ